MITVLAGENDFEITREAQRLTRNFASATERIEGDSLQPGDLPDVIMGTTLFAKNRLIIITNLSDNKAAWTALADYVPKVSDDTRVILIEPKPDKRTKTYKALQKHADIKEYKLWSEREEAAAERWTKDEAKQLGVTLKGAAARLVVARSLVAREKGAVIDQWRIMSSLEKLAPLGTVGPEEVEMYIEETPVESVFGLLETALRGDSVRVKAMIESLQAGDDPFRLFGLLGGQVFWLAALTTASEPSQSVTQDFATHPFILGKLAPYGRKLGASRVKQAVSVFADADAAMKTSAADPWLLIERALLKVAQLSGSKNSAG